MKAHRITTLLATLVLAGIFSVCLGVGNSFAATVPGLPIGLMASTTSDTSVVLSWNAPASDGGSAITKYDVQYGTFDSGPFTEVSVSPSTATSTTLSGLELNTVYTFTVAAVNAIGTSTYATRAYFGTRFYQTFADPNFTYADSGSTKALRADVFPDITSAMNATVDGGTVNVATGVYAENLTVSRNLTISGDFMSILDNSTRIVRPDACGTLIDMTGQGTLSGLTIDGNDPDQTCDAPLVKVEDGLLAQMLYVNFINSKVGVYAGSGAGIVVVINFFGNLGKAFVTADSTTAVFSIYGYWGSPNGPSNIASNPGGTGIAVDAAPGSLLLFRPYMTAWPPTDISLQSSTTISAANIQNLFYNGGTFMFSGNDLSAPITNTWQINVTEPLTVIVRAGNGESSVQMAGSPPIFGSGWYMNSGVNFDATKFSASSVDPRLASGLPAGKAAANKILQFGIPGTELNIGSPQTAFISMYVGSAYEGKTLDIYRSESLDSGWTQDGISNSGDSQTTCIVGDGNCNFYTSKFSYFAAVGDPLPEEAPAPVPAPTPAVTSTSGGSVSSVDLAKLLAPSPAATAYLAQRNVTPVQIPGCPQGFVCMPAQPIATNTPAFVRDLSLGMVGKDVLALQKYLNAHGYIIAASGPGSPGNETDMFGGLTFAAVKKFQKDHELPVTGFAGPLTRALLNK